MGRRQEEELGLTHAGGLVRTERDGTVLFLIVRASRPPYEWVLPKGHIEAGETPEQAARREVLEEAGVDAEMVRQLGDVAFTAGGEQVRVRYFLMRLLGTGAASEGREIRWCSTEDAGRLLDFETAREMVRRAVQVEKPR